MNALPESIGAALSVAAGTAKGGLRFVGRRGQEERWSWADVEARAVEVSAGLGALGVERNACVALVYPTCPEFFAAFFGILLAGAVPAPLYPPVRLGRMDEYRLRTAEMLRAARVRTVLADRKVRRVLGEAVLGAGGGCRALCLDDLPRGESGHPIARPGDLGLVQFSSGTTGAPKPVALSHRAVLWQAEAISQAILGATPGVEARDHAGVSWLPLYHDMGLIGGVMTALVRDADLTLLPPELFVIEPASWLQTVSRHRATISPAPNFAYGLCTEKIRDEELAGVDLSCWKVALNGAESVSVETLRAFAARFARWGFAAEALTPVYGLSEAALAVTFSDVGRVFQSKTVDRRSLEVGGDTGGESGGDTGRDTGGCAVEAADGVEIASVGRPLPGVDLSIRDAEGVELAERRVGRVWVRSPSLMEGYLYRRDATDDVLRQGWLDTGDLGFLLEGALYLTGRSKDILVVRGRKHLPSDVEQAIHDVPGVRKGCAAAVSFPVEGAGGEVVALFVERARDALPAHLEVMARDCAVAVRERVDLNCDLVLVLDPGTLPRTSSGKIRRAETLRQYLAGELSPPTPVTPLHVAGIMARSAIADLLAKVSTLSRRA
jgi:fatty-acyl-CoA synthase